MNHSFNLSRDLELKKERLRELFVEQMISKEEFQHDLKKLEKNTI